jgi:hypothetical protein
VSEETALAAVLLEQQRRSEQDTDAKALERLRRLVTTDEPDPWDVRDTYADPDRVRRAVGIAIVASRVLLAPGDVIDANRELVVRLAAEQLNREIDRLLNQLSEA